MNHDVPISQEARDAADMLLALVPIPSGLNPEGDIAVRVGAAMALIADNGNTRLKSLTIPDEDKAVAYFKAVGGALGMTVKFVPEHARPAVAATLFFYMANFLAFNTKRETTEFLLEFMESLEAITVRAREGGII